ncbi:MAG: radical SAM protein [Rhodospirillaceae bacterium]|nr:radical SAM protein [Rhodospirillaceae bacterium]MBT4220471.1 radical SAM protein [Rhodospirillaceae bacterium]MBT4464086.1 radical SAM protein [Rhodospirillaceae bacterium]MBT5309807.1 radical SAM protein [Rhodospirillaceae bacterium]MBT7355337.1 radical SAM protein [Rhodospirillaceae bacterium]
MSQNAPLINYARELRGRYSPNDRVLLVQLPQFQMKSFSRDIARDRGMYAYPPTGLQCVRNALEEHDLEIKIVDLNYELLKRAIEDDTFNCEDWLSLLGQRMDDFMPGIVGVTTISISDTPDNPEFPLTAALMYLKERDDAIVIAGGVNANNERDYYLRSGLGHFVVDGEGEYRAPMLINIIAGSETSGPDQNGIYFFADGELMQSSGVSTVVQSVPSLADSYGDIPVEDYCKVGSLNPFSRMLGTDRVFSTLQLNRGCRADCGFCGVLEFVGPGVRQNSVENVIDELTYLVEQRSVRHIELLDDDFLGKKTHRSGVEKVLNAMAGFHESIGLTWSAGNGLIAASLDAPMIDLINRSGCVGFRIGVESGNADMMKRLKKPASIVALEKTCADLQKVPDIFIGANFIVGLFGEETVGEMKDSLAFAIRTKLDWASFTVYQFTGNENSEKNAATGGANDFVPSKDSAFREVVGGDNVAVGKDVFTIADHVVPSREQVRQIWFSYNLVANYICNKNLMPGGNAKKFADWVEAVFIGYPDNPYMPLFAGLARILTGEEERANDNFASARRNVQTSDYWQRRFREFDLNTLIDDTPMTTEEVYERLAPLQMEYEDFARTTPQ